MTILRMAKWITPAEEEYLRREQDRLDREWRQTAQFKAEQEARRKGIERGRRMLKRKLKLNVWDEAGQMYLCIRELARLLHKDYRGALRWAKKRPSLLYRVNGHLYCRYELWHPPELPPPSIDQDGHTYYSTSALAAIRGVTSLSVRKWAYRRPHLVIRVGRRLYVRNDEYAPYQRPACIVLDGVPHYTVREFARMRGVTLTGARQWAMKRPDRHCWQDGRLYVRDEDYTRTKVPPIVWEGTDPYYSIPELARRRGVTRSAATKWADKHPHLCIRRNGGRYARDEEYHPRTPNRPMPNRTKDVAPWLKATAARRVR